MPRKKKVKGKPKRFAAKYRIKGAEDWTKYFFWATDETEAKKIWEENFKCDWPSMDYEFEKVV